MNGDIALVTGATSGIGKETAKELARLGYCVILSYRNREKAEQVVHEIRHETQNENLHILEADFSSLAQTRALAAEFTSQFPKLDILVNNAGYLPDKRQITKEGFEKCFCVNYLAPFLLTHLLKEPLMHSKLARIVNVSSVLHKIVRLPWDDFSFSKHYSPYPVYSKTKLALTMFTHELSHVLKHNGVNNIQANSIHPGVIASGFGDTTHSTLRLLIKMAHPFLSSPQKGAEAIVHLATSPETMTSTGKYYQGLSQNKPSVYSLNREYTQRLWRETLNMVQLKDGEGFRL